MYSFQVVCFSCIRKRPSYMLNQIVYKVRVFCVYPLLISELQAFILECINHVQPSCHNMLMLDTWCIEYQFFIHLGHYLLWKSSSQRHPHHRVRGPSRPSNVGSSPVKDLDFLQLTCLLCLSSWKIPLSIPD